MTYENYHVKTLIQRAIEVNHLEEFKRLCTRYLLNTHLEIVGYSFATPLIYASRLGSLDIVDYILSSPHLLTINTADNYGQNALMASIHAKNPQLFRQLAIYLPPDSKDNEENTCLHLAASVCSVEILRICIEEFGIGCERNVLGQTALHLAETPEIIEYLIVQGFNVNEQDNNGWSCLHYALYKSLEDCVRVLIQIGVDVMLKDMNGAGAVEFAERYSQGMSELIQGEMQKAQALLTHRQSPLKVSVERIEKKELDFKKDDLGLSENLRKVSNEIADEEILEVNSEEDELESTPVAGKVVLRRNASSDSIKSQLTPKLQTMISEIIMKAPSDMCLSSMGVEMIHYEELKFRELIGQGAYGKVHRGYFRSTEVAIKTIQNEKIDDRLAKEFIKEIESLVKIRHNRFLLLLGVCIEGPLCIVTELSKGGNLATAIEQNSLKNDEKLKIALQIAEGIHYIHSKTPPIVHRDLKPQNILLDEYRQVKIADLGLSRALEKVANNENINSTRVCAGTVRYMAPELYYDEPLCSRATDVWGYGCVLLHLFSGVAPWNGLELVAVQRRLILREPLVLNAKLEEGIERIVKGCCEIDPEKRIGFKEIRMMILDILGIQNSQP